MPLLNGVEVARQIRAHNRRAKIVFLTMHPETTFVVETISAGGSGCGYVVKDSAGEELIVASQGALRRRTYLNRLLAEPVMAF